MRPLTDLDDGITKTQAARYLEGLTPRLSEENDHTIDGVELGVSEKDDYENRGEEDAQVSDDDAKSSRASDSDYRSDSHGANNFSFSIEELVPGQFGTPTWGGLTNEHLLTHWDSEATDFLGGGRIQQHLGTQETPQPQSHLTISRDHTRASVHEKALLGVLTEGNSSRQELDIGIAQFINIPTVPTVPALSYLQDSSEIAFEQGSLFPEPSETGPGQHRRLQKNAAVRKTKQRRQETGLSSGIVDAGCDNKKDRSTAAESVSKEMPAVLQTVPSIQRIESKIRKLRQLQNSLYSTTWQVFHKIDGDDMTFLAEPSWIFGNGKNAVIMLKGNLPVANENAFLRHKPEVAFAVYKYYSYKHQTREIKHARASGMAMPEPTSYREAIMLLSEPIIAAMDDFMAAQPTSKTDFPNWDSTALISSPFLFWYYYRNNSALQNMEELHERQIRLLTDWIDKGYSKVYTDAETLLTQGFVSKHTMPFFIKPGEVVVSRKNKVMSGSIVVSWHATDSDTAMPGSRQRDTNLKTSLEKGWKAAVWSYGFDGSFHRVQSELQISPKFDEAHAKIPIRDLDIMPLRFAGDELHAILKRRGKTMWDCRSRILVAYEHNAEADTLGRGERYMIDFKTYRKLHSDSPRFKKAVSPSHQEMSAAKMNSKTPPEGSELLVFPSTIEGYNLRLKAWKDLEVDHIYPVVWNKQAFEHLVIDLETKHLVEALVRTKIEAEHGTDLIQGKGNGLIILLHGGPGTGKTFTAESVAEFAERPLFRVTCGDVGTKPDQVEKYLESALHLGKIWGCVVLLDEADVFLEQRTLTDLERNALVSVFLRVLEYYEGILILTSNRVGTFDEAFKSRIQLSLHYEALSKPQRREIWNNFFTRLKAVENKGDGMSKGKAPVANGASSCSAPEPPRPSKKRKFQEREDHDDEKVEGQTGIDFEDIDRFLTELADEEMNGRQIRNAITTARQLARFEGVKMSSVHLKHVIKVSRKFDKYLERLNEGHTDEQIARGEGIR